jgi:protein-L-isoaspartate(D-aspartate) O-methyltransferase
MDGADPPAADAYAERRRRMVASQLVGRGIGDAATLAAMGRVPRERFVPTDLRDRAYADGALSIGHGQTISQPFIVARMTEALRLSERSRDGRAPRVLDVGTGSGYQAAILAEMQAEVVSIELDPALAEAARALLAELGWVVEVVVGDGSEGYAALAPYDGVVCAAAAPRLPQPLTDQLADGGRLVIPLGSRDHQELTVVERDGEHLSQRSLEGCVFVPLRGRLGFGG